MCSMATIANETAQEITHRRVVKLRHREQQNLQAPWEPWSAEGSAELLLLVAVQHTRGCMQLKMGST